jgi:hypothetical protein
MLFARARAYLPMSQETNMLENWESVEARLECAMALLKLTRVENKILLDIAALL